MAALVDGGVYEIRVVGTAQQQAIINRMDYKYDANLAPTPVADSGVMLSVFAAQVWKLSVLTQLSNLYTVVRYEVREIASAEVQQTNSGAQYQRIYTDTFYDERVGDPVVDRGALNQDAMPTMVAVTLRKRTSQLGRYAYGSMRCAPATEAQTGSDGNHLTSAAANDWTNVGAILAAPVELDATTQEFMSPGLLSTAQLALWANSNPPPYVVGNFFRQITAVTPNLYLGSQTSRKTKGSLS